MKHVRLGAFWQAVLVIAISYLLLDNAFPPVMPLSLLIQYMAIVIVAVLLYFSFDDQRWIEFKQPVKSVLRDDNKALVRWLILIVVPALAGYSTFNMVKPSYDAPVELRQVHPAPPSTVKAFDKTFDLATLENPIRTEVLDALQQDPEQGWELYRDSVAAGKEVYFQNCFFCHGDLLDGQGPFAKGLNPLPANFQDVGTIAQLQESFLFWRIATGGPGLPKEGTPWNSAMPVWQEMLSEEDIWNTIMFLYDYVGQVPRIWDPEISKQVTNMKDQRLAERAKLDGQGLYQLRCAACHGEQGYGDGPAADYMYPRPRDFSLGMFKYKTTPGSTPVSDADLFATIEHGLTGTGMPGWQSLLNDEQISDLVKVVKGFDMTASFAPDDAADEDFDEDGYYLHLDQQVSFTDQEPVTGMIAYTDESVALGKQVFADACSECHGDLGRGNILSGKQLTDDWGYRIWPRDLSQPWTWRATNNVYEGANADTQRDEVVKNIYQRLSIGIQGTPMPAHRAVEEGNQDPISLEDRWHVANYVYSLRDQYDSEPSGSGVINGIKVDGILPNKVDDPIWQTAKASQLTLVPNIIKDERLFTPLNNSITVRAVFNEENIAFLLQINDRTESRPGEAVSEAIQDDELELLSDAIAIQLPKQGAYQSAPVVEKPLFRHGDKDHPVTLWYWNAGSEEPAQAPSSLLLEGHGPDTPLQPRFEDDSLLVQQQWQDGQWQIIMQRPRTGSEWGDMEFVEGQFIPISFASWDGSNAEVEGRRSLTSWHWLLLPKQEDPLQLYGMPGFIVLLVFALGLWLVRNQRKHTSN